MITISPKDMTTAGKLSTMEILWNDLCQHGSFESSNWHEPVLNSPEQQYVGGTQLPMDWEKAKQQIRNKIE
ncbi:conserved hypothetical protein [Isorropodon fossajaponicum endosymbiont JTNG4]|uniref:addiction module protein n=1 Tax=Isorropodon fossajaponicum symbiont TaxID=883811 RepID=UPI001914EECD|nr:addiction module protein [Isorropodon fossajaponicum symbiont]BBB24494.1 conserved hypothetical protein [Isorropodon fossajaponicum endosymbiont JTNG4]